MYPEKKILHLTVTKKWFSLIASGEKKEEYRDIKRYWIKRLIKPEYHGLTSLELIPALRSKEMFTDEYNVIQFRNGYSRQAPTAVVELLGMHYGLPAKPEWSDDNSGRWFFCMELGKILSIENYSIKWECKEHDQKIWKCVKDGEYEYHFKRHEEFEYK